jgi:prephenate dehydrogenase
MLWLMSLERLTILGVGLLGGSIGLAVRSISRFTRIVGYGHRHSTLDRALELGAIDEGSTDLKQAVDGADLVILCTPVGLFRDILAGIGDRLKPGAIVTDVGSTKRSVVKIAEDVLPKSVHFVGSHPMAGSERRGVEFARADLFQNAVCITTPTSRTNPEALASIEAFWKSIGMNISRLDPDTHDRLLARVSHLPHAVAAALVDVQTDDSLPLAGKGFLDATRIAGGDGGLWRDIFLDNRDNLGAALGELRARLERLEALLAAGKAEELKAWLDDVARRRESRL